MKHLVRVTPDFRLQPAIQASRLHASAEETSILRYNFTQLQAFNVAFSLVDLVGFR
jgi:hypothetical protein